MNYEQLPAKIKQAAINHLNAKLALMDFAALFPNQAILNTSVNRSLQEEFIDFVYLGYDFGKTKFPGTEFKTGLPEELATLIVFSYIANKVDKNLESGELQLIIDAAAGCNLIYRAMGLFDDIQDNDKPDSLPAKFGNVIAINVTELLLITGRELINKCSKDLYNYYQNSLISVGASKFLLGSIIYADKLSEMLSYGLRVQLLDIQENQIPLSERLESQDFCITKNSLKAGLVASYFLELGTFLGSRDFENQLIKTYKRFGFACGMAMQLIADLGDLATFLETSNKGGRDLNNRLPTLPIVYAYQALSSDQKKAFLQFWKAEPIQLDNIRSLLTNSIGMSQALWLISNYVQDAEAALKAVDPDLTQSSHRAMLQLIQNYASAGSRYFIRNL